MSLLSQAVGRIQPSATMQVTQRARDLRAAGRDVIALSTGEPDFATPEHVLEAARQAAEAGKTKYTPVNGIPELREAIVAKLARDNQLSYQPDEILVSNGAKQSVSNALIATLDPGDEVIVPAPYWVSYPEMVSLLGGKPIIAPHDPVSLKLTPQSLQARITERTKWLILNSPCNPSGVVYTSKELQALGAVLLAHPQVHVLSDDIYEHLIYDDARFTTLAQAVPELKGRTVVVNGVSKAYAMTGWRIGYAAGPAPLIKAMLKVQSQLTSGPNSVAQWAAVAALNGPQEPVANFVKVYAQRRDMALDILSRSPGLACATAQGAFYLFVSCRDLLGKRTAAGTLVQDDVAICTALLDEAGVAVVPGTAFGAPAHLRLSFATSTAQLKDACERIAGFCQAMR